MKLIKYSRFNKAFIRIINNCGSVVDAVLKARKYIFRKKMNLKIFKILYDVTGSRKGI